MRSFNPEQLGVKTYPLDSNEVGREIMARRAFIASMIVGERLMALAKPEAVHPLPNGGRILPAEYYGEIED